MAAAQILRGPQGALFEGNETGGAILLAPNRLNISELDHFFQGGPRKVSASQGSKTCFAAADVVWLFRGK